MAYNKNLAERVSAILSEPLVEKKMFGGVGYLLNGNMAYGILNDFLIIRVGLDAYDEALSQPHTRVFDTTGRVMRDWVMVAPQGYQDDISLSTWLQKGVDFARTLPEK